MLIPIFATTQLKMNRIILLTVTALLAVVCTTSPELKAQDRTEQVAMKSFGDAITPDGAITTEDLLKAMTTTDSLATKVPVSYTHLTLPTSDLV